MAHKPQEPEARSPGTLPPSPTAVVFGGGIAGLTAAHELVIRNFRVRVIERERARTSNGMMAMALGGMARTQYFPPSWLDLGDPHGSGERAGLEQGYLSPTAFPSVWVKVATGRLDAQTRKDLENFVATTQRVFKSARIHVQALVDTARRDVEAMLQPKPKRGQTEAERARKRAEAVQRALVKLMKPKFTIEVARELTPADSAQGNPPEGRGWVRVVVDWALLPGEHGFRFFPSFYDHVYDTMRRIPRYDAHGYRLPGTVYDNLISLPFTGIADEKLGTFSLPWTRFQPYNTLARLLSDLENMRRLGIEVQDLIQFALRVYRLMTMCSQRRERELENLSWWEYLEGTDPEGRRPKLYEYSRAFKELTQSSGRVLVGLDNQWGDARTIGNTYVQFLSDLLLQTQPNNVLNAPTSDSWLFHWRTHLEHLGVEFTTGRLDELRLEPPGGEELRAQVSCLEESHGPPCEPQECKRATVFDGVEADYYVLATDVVTAEAVTKGLPAAGVPGQLRGYTTLAPAAPGKPGTLARNPTQQPGLFGWDRLQTLSGIQYYFEHELNAFDGHVYSIDAEWSLSAICSHVAWAQRPIPGVNKYQSILSVDIGDWRKKSSALGKTAWECNEEELEKEVWRQLTASLTGGTSGPGRRRELPPYAEAHIDSSIIFGIPFGIPSQSVVQNLAPFLMAVKGDWKHRPGADPWDPSSPPPPGLRPPEPPGLWRAAHGGYQVHWDKLVFAGTYNRTFTRLTTMESANESARHAVNAILDHRLAHMPRLPETFRVDTHWKPGFIPTTRAGDYCRIWDPEQNEVPDFQLLKQQDERNLAAGLPHPVDLLGMELLPSLLSHALAHLRPSPAGSSPASSSGLEALLRSLEPWLNPTSGQAFLHLLQTLRAFLEQHLRKGTGGTTAPPAAR